MFKVTKLMNYWFVIDSSKDAYIGKDGKQYCWPHNVPKSPKTWNIIYFRTRQEARDCLDNYKYRGEYIYQSNNNLYKVMWIDSPFYKIMGKNVTGTWYLYRWIIGWHPVRCVKLPFVKKIAKKAYRKV